MQKEVKTTLLIATISLTLSVLIGAFGAHGLNHILTSKLAKTFHTGIEYQYYHSFGLMFLGVLKAQYSSLDTKPSMICMILGILFFSLNCYLYAITQIKFFALLVPIGGLLFIAAWVLLAISIFKHKSLNIR